MKCLVIVILLLSGFIPQVWAAQLDARIMVDDKTISPEFSFLRVIYFEYPEGGELADLLRGKNKEISFHLDSNSTQTRRIVDMINENLDSLPSTVFVRDVELMYNATLHGNQNSAVIELNLKLKPIITNPLIKEEGDLRILDANWRGISLTSPITVDTIYGKIDLNNPKSTLDIMMPEVMIKLENSDIVILETPLVNASEILKLPLHKWHSLFDNTAIIVSAPQYNFSGKHVITHFSMGECNLESGFCQDRKWIQDFELDKKYRISMIESRDDASIAIEGYSDYSSIGSIETFDTRLSSPVKEKPATNEFPATVMYGMASIALVGGIAMFVISSRKVKKDSNQGQTGIDPAYLRVFETSESAGGYKTNRGEAYLKENHFKTAV